MMKDKKILRMFSDPYVSQETLSFLEQCIRLKIFGNLTDEEREIEKTVLDRLEEMEKQNQLPKNVYLRCFFPHRRILSDWSDFVWGASWSIQVNKKM